MALVNLKELLKNAQEGKYAILATDPPYFHFAEAVIDAANERKSPVIIQISDGLDKYFNYSKLMNPLLSIVDESPVPMAVGLDHGFNFDSVMRAIKAGCTTVMFDGSRLSFKDNIKITKEIVRTAHSLGVSVEGEIGIVGGLGETDELPKLNNENKISTVSDVKRFIEETGVDAVAIAVGNVHGIVKEPVKINFNRISEIRNAIDTPLVLHGGSGLSDAVFKRAIENGICKINYYTDLIYNATLEIKKRLNENSDLYNYPDIIYNTMQHIKKVVIKKMELFGSLNKI